MIKSETIEVLKKGKPIEAHECEWVRSELESDPGDGVFDYRKICRLCGRVEHITRVVEKITFEDIYQEFHGGGDKYANAEI